MRKFLLLTVLISLAALAACGGNDNGIPPLPTPPEGGGGGGGGGAKVPLTATLKGKISFEGTAPKQKPIPTTADPGCKNPGLVDEAVVVSDGGLENVILYVSSDLAGKSFEQRKEEVVLDQMGCHYVPHAISLQTNQPLKIQNSDDTAHNVHAWSEANPSFNEAQSHKGDMKTVTFKQPEMRFPIRCDVHNWMNAFVGVFSHPLHTVSKKGGAFELKMPAGEYEITAVHENLGEQKKMVTIPDGGTAELAFSFKGK
jgi:plastocyanin